MMQNVVLHVQAGAGGADAEEWAGLLVRMYCRYAAATGWRTRVVETAGEGECVKHATLMVEGRAALDRLAKENGVHRVVRRSPFQRKGKRQTAFASVTALPAPDASEAAVDKRELRIDTFRSSGAGGQHVNKVETGVRIRHLPTGIEARADGERSQAANRKAAMGVLQARLRAAEEERRHAPVAGRRDTKPSFGSHCRTYTLHPYKQVRDERTGHKTPHVDRVLDGELALATRA